MDDQVLDFLGKIKPLFINVFLDIGPFKSANNMHILCGYLLPMLASIRAINCDNDGIKLLERHFPGTLAQAKELKLNCSAKRAYIPAYLNWLTMSAPQNVDRHGPKFLKLDALPNVIIAIVVAVRKVFLTFKII